MPGNCGEVHTHTLDYPTFPLEHWTTTPLPCLFPTSRWTRTCAHYSQYRRTALTLFFLVGIVILDTAEISFSAHITSLRLRILAFIPF